MKLIIEDKKRRFAKSGKSIENLDLEPIVVKLMEEENWTKDQCLAVEKWYKRYLALNLFYPGANIIPTKQVDTFWHYHILDTMKYQADCQDIFGYFLHHFPYFGLRGKEDAEKLARSFQETLALFQGEFKASPDEIDSLFQDRASCHSGCDSGPASCHVSCYSACHASPVLRARSNKSIDVSRPSLNSAKSKKDFAS